MMMAEGYNELTKALSRALLVLAYVIIAAASRYRRPSFCDAKQDGDPMSFLWALKRDPPAYFFGTIHVPYTRVWDHIPDNIKEAFEQSENVFFELDLMDPYTIAALASCQMLPSGKNLADILPGEMYQRLKRHLDYVKVMMPTWMTADQRGRGLYAEYLFNAITGNWEKKRPVWVMLMVNSLTESDVKSRGIPVLDLYLAQEAQRMNKRSGAVEKVEEQCVPLNGLNFTQVLFALNQTLYQHESMRSGEVQATYTTDDLIKHYNCGDLNSVIFSQDTAQVPHLLNNTSLPAEELLLARNIDHYFRQELIYKRNRRMGERVVELLQTYPDESFFFAFGAGHFLGNNTVLDYVQSRGFLVEQIPANRKLKSYKKTPHHHLHHHSHHRHKGATSLIHPEHAVSTGSSNDPIDQQQNSWEEDSSSSTSSSSSRSSDRRRYRKRQNFHQSVNLLRTSTTLPPRNHQRTFNELWVKLDDHTRSAAKHLPTTEIAPEMEDLQKHLRAWYGLPSSAIQNVRVVAADSKILFYICVFLLWTFHHRHAL